MRTNSLLLLAVFSKLSIQLLTTPLYAGIVQEGLVAQYLFDGNADDSSGNGLNAAAFGNYSYTSLGVVPAISVVGTATEQYAGGGYVQLPNFTSVLSNCVTLNLWARNEQVPVVFGEDYFAFGNMWGGNNALWLSIGGTTVAAGYNDTGNNYTTLNTQLPTEFFQDWHMLTLVLSPTSLSGYVNGVSFGSTNGSFVSPDFGYFNAIASHRWRSGEQSARLTADLANASIYNRSLTSEEIGQLYALGVASVPEPGTWAAAALLLGSAGFARWRRRNHKAA